MYTALPCMMVVMIQVGPHSLRNSPHHFNCKDHLGASGAVGEGGISECHGTRFSLDARRLCHVMNYLVRNMMDSGRKTCRYSGRLALSCPAFTPVGGQRLSILAAMQCVFRWSTKCDERRSAAPGVNWIGNDASSAPGPWTQRPARPASGRTAQIGRLKAKEGGLHPEIAVSRTSPHDPEQWNGTARPSWTPPLKRFTPFQPE